MEQVNRVNNKTTPEVICYGQTITCASTFCQEWYETASRHAARRMRQIRRAGFKCNSQGMGAQVTRVGRVKMTLVNIWGKDVDNLPAVRIENV